MKLYDSLYKVIEERVTESGHEYVIRLDPEHFIYKAHFPGEPITPGVCIMQISQELLEMHLGKKLNVKCVKNVKFLRIITPVETPVVSYSLHKISIDGEEVKVSVNVTSGDEVYARLSIICVTDN